VAEGRPSFYHPLSGAVILGADWLAFGLDLFSGFAALLAVGLLAFAVTFYGVFAVQTRLRGEPPRLACAKAFFGALAAGVPLPIAGTVVGALILALSGLPRLLGRR
jgi:hypothetical protein